MARVLDPAEQAHSDQGPHQHVHRLGAHAEFPRQRRGGELAFALEGRQGRVLRGGQSGRGKVGVEPRPDRVLGLAELRQEVRLAWNSRARP